MPLSTGYVLASFYTCSPTPAPQITLDFNNQQPTISHTRSSSYLMNLNQNSSSPSYGGEFPVLEGLTQGDIQIKYEVGFSGTEYSPSKQMCIATKNVHITIDYKPTIYISSNIPHGTCRFDTTMHHEMKHVNADLSIINEFIPRLKDAAADAVRHTQTVHSIAAGDVDDARSDITDKLSKAMNEENDEMNAIRHTTQRKIDSRFEYITLSHACPGESY